MLTRDCPTRDTDTNGLSKDQFVKVPHTQKWYDVYSDKKGFSWSKVTYWPNEPVNLNSALTRLARPSLPTKSFPAHRTGNPDEIGEVGQRLNLYLQPSRCLNKEPLFVTKQPALVAV